MAPPPSINPFVSLPRVGARSPQKLPPSITFMCGHWIYYTTTLSSSTFYVDVDGHLTCPIRERIEEIMHVQISAVSRAILKPILFQGIVSGQRPTQVGISPSSPLIQAFFSNLQSLCHELHIANGPTLVTPNLHGWQAFTILRALSPRCHKAPESPCVHGVSGTPHGEVREIFTTSPKKCIS
jgi:hypothetical protein